MGRGKEIWHLPVTPEALIATAEAKRIRLRVPEDAGTAVGSPVLPEPDPEVVKADPEVVAKATRWRFTAAYKLQIVEEAERCAGEPSAIGKLAEARGTVLVAPDDMAAGGAGERPAARRPPQAALGHRRPWKSCGAAGTELRRRET